MNIKEKIRNLLLSNDFKKLENSKYGLNIFNILKLEYKETAHSDILAYLFNIYENHYFKESMIKELIKYLSKKDANFINLLLLDYSDLEVYREYTIDNGRRLDILLVSKSNKIVILIENKIWSGEGDNQLEDYKNYIDNKYNNYNRIFLYLTTEKERKEKYKDYIHITYNNIYNILQNILEESEMTTEVGTILKQYKDMVRRDIMGEVDKEMIELCRKIYVEHKEALDKIMQYGNTRYYYTNLIADIIENNKNLKCEIVNKFLDKNYIIIMPETDENIKEILKCGKNYDRDNYVMTINLEIYDAYTNLYLQVTNPSEHNNEQQQVYYYEIVNIVDEVGYKNMWEKNGNFWYNIIVESINNSSIKNNTEENIDLKTKLNILIEKYNEIIDNFMKNNYL